MDPMNLMTVLLGSLVYRLPALIGIVVGLVMLASVPASRARSGGLLGLVLLLAAMLLGLGLSALPMLMMANAGSLGSLSVVMAVTGFVVSLVEAAGIVLLAMALLRALRPQPAGG